MLDYKALSELARQRANEHAALRWRPEQVEKIRRDADRLFALYYRRYTHS